MRRRLLKTLFIKKYHIIVVSLLLCINTTMANESATKDPQDPQDQQEKQAKEPAKQDKDQVDENAGNDKEGADSESNPLQPEPEPKPEPISLNYDQCRDEFFKYVEENLTSEDIKNALSKNIEIIGIQKEISLLKAQLHLLTLGLSTVSESKISPELLKNMIVGQEQKLSDLEDNQIDAIQNILDYSTGSETPLFDDIYGRLEKIFEKSNLIRELDPYRLSSTDMTMLSHAVLSYTEDDPNKPVRIFDFAVNELRKQAMSSIDSEDQVKAQDLKNKLQAFLDKLKNEDKELKKKLEEKIFDILLPKYLSLEENKNKVCSEQDKLKLDIVSCIDQDQTLSLAPNLPNFFRDNLEDILNAQAKELSAQAAKRKEKADKEKEEKERIANNVKNCAKDIKVKKIRYEHNYRFEIKKDSIKEGVMVIARHPKYEIPEEVGQEEGEVISDSSKKKSKKKKGKKNKEFIVALPGEDDPPFFEFQREGDLTYSVQLLCGPKGSDVKELKSSKGLRKAKFKIIGKETKIEYCQTDACYMGDETYYGEPPAPNFGADPVMPDIPVFIPVSRGF